jgi:hypothetical protein
MIEEGVTIATNAHIDIIHIYTKKEIHNLIKFYKNFY